jgi:hypothetical protein
MRITKTTEGHDEIRQPKATCGLLIRILDQKAESLLGWWHHLTEIYGLVVLLYPN